MIKYINSFKLKIWQGQVTRFFICWDLMRDFLLSKFCTFSLAFHLEVLLIAKLTPACSVFTEKILNTVFSFTEKPWIFYGIVYFWRARVWWPLLCLSPIYDYWGMLDSNTECCRRKRARYQLNHPRVNLNCLIGTLTANKPRTSEKHNLFALRYTTKFFHCEFLWQFLSVLWIQIRGSMPLTNGSGFGSGPSFFRHWPSRARQKNNFFKNSFSAY